ncbi:transporter associated domain-containing protein, partial [Chloroflexota bacterium]
YETIAGFILSLLGHIPNQNEQLRYQDMEMVITSMNGMRIEEVLLTREETGGFSGDTVVTYGNDS